MFGCSKAKYISLYCYVDDLSRSFSTILKTADQGNEHFCTNMYRNNILKQLTDFDLQTRLFRETYAILNISYEYHCTIFRTPNFCILLKESNDVHMYIEQHKYGKWVLFAYCLTMNVLLFREMTALHAAFAPKTIELAEQGTNLI